MELNQENTQKNIQSPFIEIEGKTLDEAIEGACSKLHVSEDDLFYEIVTSDGFKISNIFAKKVRIKARAKSAGETFVPEKRSNEEQVDKIESYEDLHKDDDLNDEEAVEAPKEDYGQPKRTSLKDAIEAYKFDAPSIEDDTKYEKCVDENLQKINEILNTLMEFSFPFKIKVKEIVQAEKKILIRINSIEKPEDYRVGYKIIDSIQFVMNRIVNKNKTPEDVILNIVIDFDGLIDKRVEELQRMALSVADKALKKRRIINLKERTAFERRVVHLTLADHEFITTKSHGDGIYRQISIIPKNAFRKRRNNTGRK